MTINVVRVLLPPAFGCLLLGLFGGLGRMGVLPPLVPNAVQQHGALMAVGFLAALIAAERTIASNNVFMVCASSFFGFGGLLLGFGLETVAAVLWTGGCLAFLLWTGWMWLKFRESFSNVFFSLAAALLLLGVTFFILHSPSAWYGLAWAGFFVAFIVGERMDMLKIMKASRTSYVIAGLSVLITIVGLVLLSKNFMAASFGLLLFSVIRHDVALRFFNRQGFSRYLAVGLATAYAWLAVSIAVWSLISSLDPILHSVFLGFVATMIFTHAPIILPAIVKVRHLYTRYLYIPFVMLQSATLLRVFSAITLNVGLWSLSGIITVLSVQTFLVVGLVGSYFRKTIYTK